MLSSDRSISVVIPTYNNLRLFINAISSVLNQTVLPKEIIVSDDSSNDYIEKWCIEHSNPIIKYYRNKPAKGAVNNWNSGINKTKENWIILMHHDEEFKSCGYLESLSSHFEEADVIISDIRVKTSNEIRKGKFNGILKKFLINNPMSLFIINYIGPCACICFKRNLITEFDTHLTWLVDVEWYMHILRSANRIIYDSNLIIQSNHGHCDQITNNIDVIDMFHKDINYLNKKYASFKKISFFLYLSKIFNHIKVKFTK